MTPLLLSLAGILPGDGGPGMGAAREAVAVTLGDGFQGFMQLPGGPLLNARLEKGELHISYPAGSTTFHRCAVSSDEGGGFWLEWAGNVFRGDAARGPHGVVLTLRTGTTKAGARLLTDLLRRGGTAR